LYVIQFFPLFACLFNPSLEVIFQIALMHIRA
jgi:hypothetical protein